MSFSWLAMGTMLAIPYDLPPSPFAPLVLVCASAFSFLITLYSWTYMDGHPRQREYYAYLLATLAMTCGAVLAENLILLLAFWELTGLLLFLMITIGGRGAFAAAT